MNRVYKMVRMTWLAAVTLAAAVAGFAADVGVTNNLPLEKNLAISSITVPGSGEIGGQASRPNFDVRHYGAVGNGTNLDTQAIQEAIDAAARDGGGSVLLPPGSYLCGSLTLKSHVTLWLEKGATLLGSPHRADYRKLDFYALLLAEGQEDIGIGGEGVVDGQGRLLVADTRGMMPQRNPPYADESQRPFIINFRSCRNVAVRGITLKESACWVQDYHDCDNLIVENVTVRTMSAITNDGLDIDGCSQVIVRGCDIDSEDDGICLKSSTRLCDNVLVENCRVRSSCYAFKLGTASVKGFKNITCRNVDIYDTYRSGIALEVVDGGELENVNISHIQITNTANAIFIRLGHRNAHGPVGVLRNVTISDVKAEITSRSLNEMNKFPSDWLQKSQADKENVFIPATITGIPDHPVSGITLRNVSIIVDGIGGKSKRGKTWPDFLAAVPEVENKYPSCAMFGSLPAWGFYCRHVNGIEFTNVTLQVKGQDFRPALACDDVENIALEGCHVLSAGSEPVIVLKDVNGAAIHDSPAPQNTVRFVETIGGNKKNQSSIIYDKTRPL
jgi:hypothetical protein